MPQPNPQPLRFPLLGCFQAGVKLLAANFRPVMLMCLVPFAVYAVTLTVQRLIPIEISPLMVAITLLPANFLLGVVGALVLRWLVLGEHPAAETNISDTRNMAVRDAGIAAATVAFLFAGLLTAVLYRLQPALMAANPAAPANAEDMLFSAIALFILLWAGRFMWLSAPMALGFDVRGFFKILGGFAGSIRVFALFALCGFLASLPFDMIRTALHSFSPTAQELPAILTVFDSVLLAGSKVVEAMLFACATAAALRYILKKETSV